MSHNVDFATYSRTGVFWRGGLLHSVSGVSYWTLQAGIVGHLRPYANNGRILLVILFPRDPAAVTVLDSNDVWAFYAGMSRHDIWHLGVDQQYPGVFRAPATRQNPYYTMHQWTSPLPLGKTWERTVLTPGRIRVSARCLLARQCRHGGRHTGQRECYTGAPERVWI